MKEWSGLERVFRLSLGIELGATALALLAALEFKKLLQKDLRGIEKNDNQPVSLSSEEWRSAAGIFDRKAYDRAKAKLEDQGIVHIEREGRVLRVTLWPNLMKGDPDQAVEDLPEPQIECLDITRMASSEDNEVSVIMEALERTVENKILEKVNGTEYMTTDETTDGTTDGTTDRTTDRTADVTTDRTADRTTDGTADRTTDGTTHRTVDASIPDTDRLITPTPRLTSLNRSPLERYSLTLSSLTRYSQSNPSTNPIRLNNEQRSNELPNNEQRYNELRIRDDLEKSNSIPLTSLINPNGLIKVNDISPTFKRLWQSEMGHALTRYEEGGIQRFVRMGYSEEILTEALRYAVLSDRRHMGYLLGILRNWYRAGVRQHRDIPLVQQRWEDKRFMDQTPVPSVISLPT